MSTLTVGYAPILRPRVSGGARLSARTTAPCRPSPAQLTRRGRLAVTVVALALAIGTPVAVGASASQAGDSQSGPRVQRLIVQPGQSLWQFAAAAMPGVDTREAVLRVKELNALSSSTIHPGQRLLIPVG